MSLSLRLAEDFNSTVRLRGHSYHAQGLVRIRHGSATEVEAQVRGSRNYHVVLEYYDETMEKAGWQPIIPTATEENAKFRGYSKGALEVVITADKRNGATSVSIGEMGAGNN